MCPSQKSAAQLGGVEISGTVGSVGGDIVGGDKNVFQTINKIDLTSLPEFVKAFSNKENASKELLEKATRTRDEIAAELQMTEGAVDGFFRALGERSVPPEQLKAKLIEKATLYLQARQLLAALNSDDPAAKALADRARVELDKGNPEKATVLVKKWRSLTDLTGQLLEELQQESQQQKDK